MESASPMGCYFHTHMNNVVCPFVHKHGNTQTDWGRQGGHLKLGIIVCDLLKYQAVFAAFLRCAV